MRITTAQVKDGRVEVDAEALSEGQLVRVVLLDDEPVHLTQSERAWLKGAIADAHAGETSDAVAFLEELEAAD